MKAYLVGTALVLLGAILAIALKAFGASPETAVVCGIGVSVIGFGIQVHTAFGLKRKFEQETKQAQEAHRAAMAAAAKLPPEEAIALLLRNK